MKARSFTFRCLFQSTEKRTQQSIDSRQRCKRHTSLINGAGKTQHSHADADWIFITISFLFLSFFFNWEFIHAYSVFWWNSSPFLSIQFLSCPLTFLSRLPSHFCPLPLNPVSILTADCMFKGIDPPARAWAPSQGLYPRRKLILSLPVAISCQ